MLTAVRAEVSDRLAEVFQLFEHIRHLESAPPAPDPPEAKILRGLFHVHLYAALERTVNQGVQRFLQSVTALRVPPQHLQTRFFSVALDPSFSSMRNGSEDKRWSSRVKLLDLQNSHESQQINADIFGLYLQNVKAEKLEVLFSCLNIGQPIVPTPSFRLYIDELADYRNGVSHGRFSALGIGSSRRSPELLIRFNAISATCIHVLDCFEQHHLSRGLILEAHRPAYS
jgi:hypothetical protein